MAIRARNRVIVRAAPIKAASVPVNRDAANRPFEATVIAVPLVFYVGDTPVPTDLFAGDRVWVDDAYPTVIDSADGPLLAVPEGCIVAVEDND